VSLLIKETLLCGNSESNISRSCLLHLMMNRKKRGRIVTSASIKLRKLLNKLSKLDVTGKKKAKGRKGKQPEAVNEPLPPERSQLHPILPMMTMMSLVKRANLKISMRTQGRGPEAPMIWTKRSRFSRI